MQHFNVSYIPENSFEPITQITKVILPAHTQTHGHYPDPTTEKGMGHKARLVLFQSINKII